MCNMSGRTKLKILLAPYPAQGHVTPILKLASLFVSWGFEPVLLTPEFIHSRIVLTVSPRSEISLMSFPYGLEKDETRDFFAIENVVENVFPIHVERIIRNVDEDERVVCVVVDLLASYAVEISCRCSVPAAGFWPVLLTTYCLIDAIPEMVKTGCILDTALMDARHLWVCKQFVWGDLRTRWRRR